MGRGHDCPVHWQSRAEGDPEEAIERRLRQYMQFGQGKQVGHWGGRYIWQLDDSDELLVCWKVTESSIPREVEKELVRAFEKRYKKLPFAILCH